MNSYLADTLNDPGLEEMDGPDLGTFSFRRDFIQVRDVMTRDVATVGPLDTVTLAARMMLQENVPCVVVEESGEAVGILTETDLFTKTNQETLLFDRQEVAAIMSAPVLTVQSDASVTAASELMESNGIVTKTHICRGIKNKLRQEMNRTIRQLQRSKGNHFIIGPECDTVYINPALAKLLAISHPSDLTGKIFLPSEFWWDPHQRTEFIDELKMGVVEGREITLRTVTGRRIHCIVFAAFSRNAYGEIVGSQGTLYDITSMKQSQGPVHPEDTQET